MSYNTALKKILGIPNFGSSHLACEILSSDSYFRFLAPLLLVLFVIDCISLKTQHSKRK